MPASVWNGTAWKKVTSRAVWNGSVWKQIASSHVWDGSVWKAVYSALKPQGMTKTGNQLIPQGMTQVAGWTADANSTVTSNALVIAGSKSGAVLNAKVVFASNYNTRIYQMEIRRGATVLASKSGNGTVSGVMSLTLDPTTVTVAAGDQLTFWANSAFTANRVDEGTFLSIV